MSECNKCNGSLFVCENHPDQEAHQCKHCGGAGMPCECTKMTKYLNFIYELIIQTWLLLVAFSLVYGIGMGVCEAILWGLR